MEKLCFKNGQKWAAAIPSKDMVDYNCLYFEKYKKKWDKVFDILVIHDTVTHILLSCRQIRVKLEDFLKLTHLAWNDSIALATNCKTNLFARKLLLFSHSSFIAALHLCFYGTLHVVLLSELQLLESKLNVFLLLQIKPNMKNNGSHFDWVWYCNRHIYLPKHSKIFLQKTRY